MKVPIRLRRVAFRIFQGCLSALAFAMLFACLFSPDEKPTLDELIYNPHRVMLEDPKDNVRRTQFFGERDYREPNSKYFKPWQFKFESGTDVMKVTVTDTQGVRPGYSYTYTLSQVQGVDAVQVWRLTTENPATATQLEHIFEFEFRLRPALNDPRQFPFKPDVNVRGNYEFSQSQREMAVDIYFDVRKRMNIAEAGPLQD